MVTQYTLLVMVAFILLLRRHLQEAVGKGHYEDLVLSAAKEHEVKMMMVVMMVKMVMVMMMTKMVIMKMLMMMVKMVMVMMMMVRWW